MIDQKKRFYDEHMRMYKTLTKAAFFALAIIIVSSLSPVAFALLESPMQNSIFETDPTLKSGAIVGSIALVLQVWVVGMFLYKVKNLDKKYESSQNNPRSN